MSHSQFRDFLKYAYVQNVLDSSVYDASIKMLAVRVLYLLFDAVSLSHTPKSFYLYLLIPHNLANVAPLYWGAISFPKTIYVQYSVPNIFISCISSSEQSLIVKHILRSCVGVLSHHSSQSPFAQPYNKPNIIYVFSSSTTLQSLVC